MSKIDLVRSEMMAALKNKDTARKEALSILLSSLKAKFIDKRSDLTEDEENAIVYKEIKEAQETIDSTPLDRIEIISECKIRITIFTEFAPQRMSESEIREVIKNLLNKLQIKVPTIKEKGTIMKNLMPLVKDKADGSLVNKLVGELFE